MSASGAGGPRVNRLFERAADADNIGVVVFRGLGAILFAIGTAIASEPDGAIGAISISGPRSRITRERIEEELAPALLNKKNIIELKIRQFE